MGSLRAGLVAAVLGVLCCAGAARAAFTKVTAVPVKPGAYGITFDGTQWHISEVGSNRWANYDPDFNFIDYTDLSGPTGNGGIRGIEYSPVSGTVFTVGYDSPVREYRLDGSLVQTWDLSSSGDGLAVDPRDGSVWVAPFAAPIQHRTAAGALISSFKPDFNVNGIAVDPVNDTLLVLQGNNNFEDDDRLYEFRPDGTPLGQLLGDEIPQNGLDLAYDGATGTLYAAAQEGVVTIFRDPSRVPEPGGLLLFGAAGLLLRRRRRETCQ